MLYNKSMVAAPKPIDRQQRFWAQKLNPFVLPQRVMSSLEDFFVHKDVLKEKPIEMLESLAQFVKENVSYDYKHDYLGLRYALRTLIDKKGHCIEQNILLYSLVHQFFHHSIPKFSWLITKNPRGYQNKPFQDVGVHPFLLFREQDKEYVIDGTGGTVEEFYPEGFAMVSERLAYREFVAWSLAYGGEDAAFIHYQRKSSLTMLGAAKAIDPNNYTVNILAASVFDDLGRFEKAERLYQSAIRIAPHAVEPWHAYASFLVRWRGQSDKAHQIYQKAVEKTTSDVQVLDELERDAAEFGDSRVMHLARKKKNALLRTRHYRKYFEKEK